MSAKAKCTVCGDLRIDAEKSQAALEDELRGKGWRFAEWGVVCSPCRREAKRAGFDWRGYANGKGAR